MEGTLNATDAHRVFHARSPASRAWDTLADNSKALLCIFLGVLCFSLAVVLVISHSQDAASTADGGNPFAVRKSPRDPRQFRFTVLDNGMQVLLVSDSNSANAAAALSVRAGHFHDPVRRALRSPCCRTRSLSDSDRAQLLSPTCQAWRTSWNTWSAMSRPSLRAQC